MADFKTSTVQFDPSNLSAFGTLEVADMTPVIQGDFVYGLNTQLWNTAVVSGAGATVDTNASRLRIQSGTAAAGYAYITSRRLVRYRAGQGTTARFTTIFTAGAANNVQLFGMGTISSNVPYDGYFFGYNGTAFGIVRYAAGTPTWVAQASWNGDKCNGGASAFGTLDPTKGNVAMIKYPYLGFGDIDFYLLSPTSGRWVLCHTIQYPNAFTATQLTNPTLQFVGFTLNSGNTTNQLLYCGSIGVFISGQRSFVGNPKWATDTSKASITTEAALLNLRNCTTYNGVTNRGLLRINSLSCSNSANTTAFVRFKINATLGGSPSYAPISGSTVDAGVTITGGNSIASVDTAGTLTSGGTYIYNVQLGPSGSQFADLTPYNIFVAPTEILTITGAAVANATIGVSLNWTEDI